MDWNYTQPVSISFGNDSIEELVDIIKLVKGQNGLLVSD